MAEATSGTAPRPKGARLRKVMQFIFASSKDHAFLDRPYIGPLLAVIPHPWKRKVSSYLLTLSPHYYLANWDAGYPADWTLEQKRAEAARRGTASRQRIIDKLLKPFLTPDMHVLDFGCGPGALSRAMAPYVRKVTAVDVSRGVIACVRAFNTVPNIEYRANRLNNLAIIDSSSVDVVFSFAVIQHLLRENAEAFIREFYRVLKPGGRLVFHTILRDPENRPPDPGEGDWLHRRIMLRMVFYTREEMHALIAGAGFTDIHLADIPEFDDLDEGHRADQVVIAIKPAA